jgi:hypothetical protein
MTRQLVAAALLLAAAPVSFAEPVTRRVAWSEFQKEAARVQLNGRKAVVSIRGGEPVKCQVKAVREDGIVVEPGRKTRQWARTGGEHRIPREMIASIRSGGRTGRRGTLGAVIGLAAAAAVGAVAATGADNDGYEILAGGVVAGVLAIPTTISGHLVGRRFDQPIPVYQIVPDEATDGPGL